MGLLWAAEPLAGLCSPLLGRAALPFARVLAPWLTTLPLLALLHGGAPLWGVAANLVLLPLVAFLAPVGLALVLVPARAGRGAGPGRAAGLDRAAPGAVLRPDRAPGHRRACGRGSPCSWAGCSWPTCTRGSGGPAGCARPWPAAPWACWPRGGTGRAPAALSLEAVDIGQGDALLLRVPGGDATLVDTGPDPRAARRIARVLSRRGVREPVHLVVTHPHLDHAGGWATLARLWPAASAALPAMAGPERPLGAATDRPGAAAGARRPAARGQPGAGARPPSRCAGRPGPWRCGIPT